MAYVAQPAEYTRYKWVGHFHVWVWIPLRLEAFYGVINLTYVNNLPTLFPYSYCQQNANLSTNRLQTKYNVGRSHFVRNTAGSFSPSNGKQTLIRLPCVKRRKRSLPIVKSHEFGRNKFVLMAVFYSLILFNLPNTSCISRKFSLYWGYP